MIKKLDWDTNFFEIKIGKVEIKDESEFDPIFFKEQAKDEKFELIYIFKYNQMLSWIDIIKANLELVDIMLTMQKKFEKNKYMNNQYEFRTELAEKELVECYNIAEETAIVSRFYKDNNIGKNKTKELYRKWIDNTLNQTYSDGLFIEKNEDCISGIHLIKTDEKNKVGYCSVIGVNNLIKGRGIGKNLWNQAFGYWANEKEIEYCKVPFSLQNKESFNFHLKIGFDNISEIKYVYHFWNLIK